MRICGKLLHNTKMDSLASLALALGLLYIYMLMESCVLGKFNTSQLRLQDLRASKP